MARRTQQESVLDRTRSNLEARVAELRPLVEELHQLEAALRALPRNAAAPRAATRTQGRPSMSTRRRAKRGQRPRQILRIVKANPGITVSGVAKKMAVQPSSLYGVANTLLEEGKLKKEGAQLTAK